MKNLVNCKCGSLHGSIEMVQLKLVINSRRKRDDGLKCDLAYSLIGRFIIDARQNLLRCAECNTFAMTAADWQAVDNPNAKTAEHEGAGKGLSLCEVARKLANLAAHRDVAQTHGAAGNPKPCKAS